MASCHATSSFGSSANVEEGSQQVDCRDRDNRAEQFKLEPTEIDVFHPGWPVFTVAGVQLRDEILVAYKRHHQGQISNQRQVDEAEHKHHEFPLLHGKQEGNGHDQLFHEP